MKISFRFILIGTLLLTLAACKTTSKNSANSNDKASSKERTFVIETPYGQMKGRLSNLTPLHRDNFIKLVESGYYDSLLFHRVIANFMIQGGDPDSKYAKPNVALGNGGPDYTIPAEFVSGMIHQKGALAAARTSDHMNPTKASSGSQFYIVQGNVYDSLKMQQMTTKISENAKQKAFQKMMASPEFESAKIRLDLAKKNNDKAGHKQLLDSLNQLAVSRSEYKPYNAEQLKVYATVGGTPHLDGDYSVFGQIYEGLDVLDKIAKAEGDRNNRPKTDIRFSIKMTN